MTERASQGYSDTAEAAWRWVLDQVHWHDGPWIPESVTVGGAHDIPDHRDGMHSGTGGLAHALAEIRLTRPWTAEEEHLAGAIVDRIRAGIPTSTDATFFDGLVSDIGVLTALGAAGTDDALARLAALLTPDGWPQTALGPPGFPPETRLHDATLGTAGVLLGALWARRVGAPATPAYDAAPDEAPRERATALAETAAAVLLAEEEHVPTGGNWRFVAPRFRPDFAQMPNYSHGVAGIATALALAGAELGRPDLTAAAHRGAEHLVSLGDCSGQGLKVPRYLPTDTNDEDEFTYTWCHGGTGTSLLFLALDRADVDDVAGAAPLSWHRRCLHSVRTSGLPARLHPGFWDNDGRCCGTTGVGEAFLDSWQRAGEKDDLDFALGLADTLLERAVREGPHAYWRFIEHRKPDPLLPPAVGWMQGAAGIAAFLFRAGRALREGPATATAPRMETWWALPGTGPHAP